MATAPLSCSNSRVTATCFLADAASLYLVRPTATAESSPFTPNRQRILPVMPRSGLATSRIRFIAVGTSTPSTFLMSPALSTAPQSASRGLILLLTGADDSAVLLGVGVGFGDGDAVGDADPDGATTVMPEPDVGAPDDDADADTSPPVTTDVMVVVRRLAVVEAHELS